MCASYMKGFSSAALILERISFLFRYAICTALTQESQLKLELGPSESSHPSQSESSAWLLPDSAASTLKISMTSLLTWQERNGHYEVEHATD